MWSDLPRVRKAGKDTGYIIYFYYGFRVSYVSEYVKDVNYEINRINNHLIKWTTCFVYDRGHIHKGMKNRNALEEINNPFYFKRVALMFFNYSLDRSKNGYKDELSAVLHNVPYDLINDYLSDYPLRHGWDYVNVFDFSVGVRGRFLERINNIKQSNK